MSVQPMDKSRREDAAVLHTDEQFWQHLIESNIRASTMASRWCIRTTVVKKLSLAFHHWKLVAAMTRWEQQQHALRERETERERETPISVVSGRSLSHSVSGTVSLALDRAIAVIHQYKTSDRERDRETERETARREEVDSINIAKNYVQSTNTQFESIARPARSLSLSQPLSHSQSLAQPAVAPDALQTALPQTEFLSLSETLLDTRTDSETKRRILLQLSGDIIDRSPPTVPQRVPHTLSHTERRRERARSSSTDRSVAPHSSASQPRHRSPHTPPTQEAPSSSYTALYLAQRNAQSNGSFPPNAPSRSNGSFPPNAPQISNGSRSNGTPRAEDFQFLRFRHGRSGDFVRELVAPQALTTPSHNRERESAVRETRSASQHRARAHNVAPQRQARTTLAMTEVSPSHTPHYLVSTNASRKKTSHTTPPRSATRPLSHTPHTAHTVRTQPQPHNARSQLRPAPQSYALHDYPSSSNDYLDSSALPHTTRAAPIQPRVTTPVRTHTHTQRPQTPTRPHSALSQSVPGTPSSAYRDLSVAEYLSRRAHTTHTTPTHATHWSAAELATHAQIEASVAAAHTTPSHNAANSSSVETSRPTLLDRPPPTDLPTDLSLSDGGAQSSVELELMSSVAAMTLRSRSRQRLLCGELPQRESDARQWERSLRR